MTPFHTVDKSVTNIYQPDGGQKRTTFWHPAGEWDQWIHLEYVPETFAAHTPKGHCTHIVNILGWD